MRRCHAAREDRHARLRRHHRDQQARQARLANAALGASPVASDVAHLVLWAAMASMFGVTTDRRFLALAASYLAFLPIAIAWPERHLEVLGLANAVLIAFVMVVWRRTAPLPRALGA